MRSLLGRAIFTVLVLVAILLIPFTAVWAGGQTDSGATARTVELSLGHTVATGHPYHAAMQQLADLVAERTNGAVTIRVYPAAQMGELREMLESVSMGTLDMGFPGSAHVGRYNPRFSIFQTPYIARDVDHMIQASRSPAIAAEIEKTAAEDNIRVLAFPFGGIRHVTTRNVPVETPADMAGLKIRTPELPMTMEFMRTVGAGPTPMALSELYLALQQGVVDGQENPVPTIYWERLHEVQGYLNLTGHIVLLQAIVISESSWQRLTKAQQDILQQAAYEVSDNLRAVLEAEDARLIEEMKKQGVVVIQSDVDAFRAATSGMIATFEQEWGVGFAREVFGE